MRDWGDYQKTIGYPGHRIKDKNNVVMQSYKTFEIRAIYLICTNIYCIIKRGDK
jgi:hypothetical protein